jgi:beta-lactamase class A
VNTEARDIEQDLAGAFAAAGVEGFLHAVPIEGGAEVRYRAERLNHTASVGKVPILVALMRSVERGELALDQRVVVPAGSAAQLLGTLGSPRHPQQPPDPASGKTPGPTGLSVMKYPVEIALRDVAQLMIALSDNHSTDIVLSLVPPDKVTATMRELGLEKTTIAVTLAQLYQRAQARLQGAKSLEEAIERARSDPDFAAETAIWRSTAEEMTQLFSLIWNNRAASPELCAEMRGILYSQLRSHLAEGFPDGVAVGSKTGTTTTGIRNECGVVELPDGNAYAVAVFTRAESAPFRNPAADAAIGTAARLAIERLHGAPIAPAGAN